MKKVLLSIIIAAAATTVNAQKGNYFYANLGGGLHNINYATGSFGSKTPGLGFNAGIGWQWMFSEHFGVGLGANFNTQKTAGKLSFSESTQNLTDKENGLNYTRNISFNGLKEVDKQSVLDIPLSLYYQSNLSERLRLLIGVNGFYTKVLSQDYKTKSGDISVGKFFPDYNLDYSGIEDKEHGIFTVSDFSGDTKLKEAVYGIGAQVQFCYALGEKRRTELTFGIYGAYRFTNQKDIDGNIFDAETAEYHGIAQSNIADKISSCNLGGIVGLRFRIGGREKHKEVEEPAETIPVEIPPVVAQTEKEPEQDTAKVEPVAVVENTQPEVAPEITSEPEPVKTEPSQPQVSRLEETLRGIQPIQMGLNSTTIPPAMRPVLDDVANAWKENPSQKILIIGHTCNLGSLETNKRLGLQRAETVKQELSNRGVNPKNLTTETRWFKEPLVPNTSEENRKKNRRVEIKLLK